MDNQNNTIETNKPNQLHYDAFISYRHSELDMYVAKTLHRKLESFRMPKSVLKKYPDMRKKLDRVFRDEEELPLSDNLSDPIDAALNNSDFLIVICTPRLPESRWCQKEIETFIKLHGRQRVLVVLAEGEPEQAFPEILTYEDIEVKKEDGTTIIERKSMEPLGAEARGKNRKEINKNLDDAVVKICAAIFGLNYDDLRQRHREQKIRKIATACATAAAVLLSFLCVCIFFLIRINIQNATISQQYEQIKHSYAIAQAEKSSQLLREGKRYESVKTARDVLPDNMYEEPEPSVLYALNKSFGTYYVEGKLFPHLTYQVGPRLIDIGISKDGSVVAGYDKAGIVYIFDEKGKILDTIEGISEDYFDMSLIFAGNDNLIICNGGQLYRYDIHKNKLHKVALPEVQDEAYVTIASCNDDMYFATVQGMIYCISTEDEIRYSLDLTERYEYNPYNTEYTSIFYDEDKGIQGFCIKIMEYDTQSVVLLIDAATGNVVKELKNPSANVRNALLDGDILYTIEEFVVGQSTEIVSMVTAYNLVTGDRLWERKYTDCRFLNISLFECQGQKCLLTYGSYGLLVVDAEDGQSLGQTITDYGIVTAYHETDTTDVYFICSDGTIKSINLEYSYISDVSDLIMEVPIKEKVLMAEKVEDSIIVLFDSAGYAVKYSPFVSEKSELTLDNAFTDLSSDCRFVLHEVDQGKVCVYDLDKEEDIWSVEGRSYAEGFIKSMENAVYVMNDDLVVYDFLDDKVLATVSPETENSYFYRLFDNDSIAVFEDDKKIYVYDVISMQEKGVFKKSKYELDCMAFLEEAYICVKAEGIFMYDYDDYEIAGIAAMTSRIEYFILSRDGKYLGVLYTDGQVKIYATDDLTEISTNDLDYDMLSGLEYYPDKDIYVADGFYESYILDKGLNIIAKTNKIYGIKNDNIYIYLDGKMAVIDYLEYEAILKKVDEYLVENE